MLNEKWVLSSSCGSDGKVVAVLWGFPCEYQQHPRKSPLKCKFSRLANRCHHYRYSGCAFLETQKICSPGQVWKSLPDLLGSEAGEDRNKMVLFCSDWSISGGNLLSGLPVSIFTCGDAGRHWGQEEITSKYVLPTSCWLFPPKVSSACNENK